MLRQILVFISLFSLMIFWPTNTQARPTYQSETDPVRICYTDNTCLESTIDNTEYVGDLEDVYIPHVLANEWHTEARLNALKAGAISIRTFSVRFGSCGAYKNSIVVDPGPPPFVFDILDNRSQRYRLGTSSSSRQNPVTANHTQAQSETYGMYLNRGDNVAACTKYNANTGNPTKACVSGECTNDAADQYTLPEMIDPVYSNNFVGPRYAVGMSQNGSAAWAEGPMPWDYRMITTNYYRGCILARSDDYHWVWLDVGNDIVFTGYNGEEYYGPVFNAPNAMEMGQSYSFGIHLKNTGRVTWQQSGSGRTQVGLYWDDNRGSAQFSDLGENMDPGEDDSVQVNVSPPSAGTHCLTADLIRNGNWFSDQSSPAWPVLRKCINIVSPDTTPPSNPTGQSGSHLPNQWSPDNTIEAHWSGASDDRTPTSQLAYSIEWTTSPSTIPDTIPEPPGNSNTSPPLVDGSWWLHIRTRDQAGNWADGASHFGPFLIDTTPPMGSHNAPDWWLTPDFTVSWNGMDASGVVFDFDYALNNGDYQDWFTTNDPSGSRVYDRGANVNDFIHIRACLTDLVGHSASPPCTYSHTAIHIIPYLDPDPASLTTCFALADTTPQTGTVFIKNRGPGSLDWTAVAGQYLSLNPTSGTNVVSGFPGTLVYTLTNPAAVGQHTTVITLRSSTENVGNNPVVVPVSIRVAPDQCEYYLYLPTIYKTTP